MDERRVLVFAEVVEHDVKRRVEPRRERAAKTMLFEIPRRNFGDRVATRDPNVVVTFFAAHRAHVAFRERGLRCALAVAVAVERPTVVGALKLAARVHAAARERREPMRTSIDERMRASAIVAKERVRFVIDRDAHWFFRKRARGKYG